MFIKLTRINQKGENKENLVDTATITAVIEIDPKTTKLYDDRGELVETKVGDRLFKVFTNTGLMTYHVNEETFELLAKTLSK